MVIHMYRGNRRGNRLSMLRHVVEIQQQIIDCIYLRLFKERW